MAIRPTTCSPRTLRAVSGRRKDADPLISLRKRISEENGGETSRTILVRSVLGWNNAMVRFPTWVANDAILDCNGHARLVEGEMKPQQGGYYLTNVFTFARKAALF